MKYDPAHVATFFDDYGEQEWTRFDDGRTPRPSLEVHLEHLRRFVNARRPRAGHRRRPRPLHDRAGTDRRRGHRRGPLRRPARAEQGASGGRRPRRVESSERVVADVTDLWRWADDRFDAAVCFGGPLSYILDGAERGVAELVRVTKPGGHVLVSVMSLVGAVVHFLPILLDLVRRDGVAKNDAIVRRDSCPTSRTTVTCR